MTELIEAINNSIDRALLLKRNKGVPRGYLGASRLGINCSRQLQYEYRFSLDSSSSSNNESSGANLNVRMIRVFEAGHLFESLLYDWLNIIVKAVKLA